MTRLSIAALVASALCAGVGNLLFKIGATGRESIIELVNVPMATGLVLYGAGVAFWLFGLSKNDLTMAYPFTALSFIVIYGLSMIFLGERPAVQAYFGVALIVLGIGLVASSAGG